MATPAATASARCPASRAYGRSKYVLKGRKLELKAILESKAVCHILVSSAENMHTFNTGFDTVNLNLHRPTMHCASDKQHTAWPRSAPLL
jgi:hypothetical protein